MNKKRRSKIEEIRDHLEDLKSQIDELQEEEQVAYENLPEGIQAADRGYEMEAAAERLSDASSSLEDVICFLDESII